MDDLSETATYNANLGPIDFEVDLGPLPVSGTLPRELNGALVRNGPNPLFPDPAEHWFTGDGMIHRFAFAGGEVRYRNRWVRTKRWQAEQAAGCNLPVGFDPTTPNAASFDDGVANTNVLLHGGRLLALEEADRPVELDAHSLATLGPVDFGDRLNGPFTAHPKLDPQTGELLFFGYGTPDALSAGMSFGSLDAAGNVTRFDRFDAPYASMVHDFMVTAHHVLFPVTPLAGSIDRARAGMPPFAWEPERGSYVGVMRRDAGVDSIEWWRAPACFVFHVMNAWEADGCLYADVMQFDAPPHFPWPDGRPVEDTGPAHLYRWTFDLGNTERTFTQQRLWDVPGEFPRIDDRFSGSSCRHGWFAGHRGDDAADKFARIVHVDHRTQALDIHDLGAGDSTSEPVFVPRTPDAPEGDGWILAVIFRGELGRSDVVVLDALHISAGPVATVALPHRVPNGFHGNWITAAAIDAAATMA